MICIWIRVTLLERLSAISNIKVRSQISGNPHNWSGKVEISIQNLNWYKSVLL